MNLDLLRSAANWLAFGIVLGILELLLPGFVLLGFGIGAAVVAGVLFVVGPEPFAGFAGIAAQRRHAIGVEPGAPGAHHIPVAGFEVGLQPEQPVHTQRHQAGIAINNGNGEIHQIKIPATPLRQ